MNRSGPDIPDKFSTFANDNNETDPNDNSTRPRTDYQGQGSTDSPAHTSCFLAEFDSIPRTGVGEILKKPESNLKIEKISKCWLLRHIIDRIGHMDGFQF